MSERSSWGKYQRDVHEWKSRIVPREQHTPQEEFYRSFEEVVELDDAIMELDGSPEARQAVAEEATDMIIRMLGVISTVGGDASSLLEKKIGVMQQKYPAGVIERQIANGVPFEQAMKEHKTGWENPHQAKVITLFTGRPHNITNLTGRQREDIPDSIA